jgi:hypothetical protein
LNGRTFKLAEVLGEKPMRVALLLFVLSIPFVHTSAQQAPSATTPEEPLPREPVPQNSPCMNQSKSLSELIESFTKGRVASAPELKGTWVAIGDFDNAIHPHYRSLNCAGVMRGKKFEFALVSQSYDWVMELHAIGYEVQRLRMEPNHKGSLEFSVDLQADGAEAVFTCRFTRRGTLACLNVMSAPDFKRTGAFGGEEFKRMKAADSQLFDGNEP